MNEYEMMTIFHPRLNADETSAAVAALEEQVRANGGELLSTDNWGRRRLAYPIDGVIDGTYVLMTFRMPAEATATLERGMRLSENILRHLLIRGIIPFEGDRSARDERDDRSDYDRGRDRDFDSDDEEEQPEERRREETPSATAPAEAADTSATETPGSPESPESAEPAGEESPVATATEDEATEDED